MKFIKKETDEKVVRDLVLYCLLFVLSFVCLVCSVCILFDCESPIQENILIPIKNDESNR